MSTTEYFEEFVMPARGHYHAEVWLAGDDGVRVNGTHLPTGDTIADTRHYDVFGDKPEWRDSLPPNSEISPPGTKWARDLTGGGINPADPPIYFEVIVSAIAEDVSAHLTDVPTAVPSGAVEDHKDKLHRKNIRIPNGWGENSWFTGRALAASQVVGIDFWGDSISSDGAGVQPPSSQATLGVAGLIESYAQAAYGDGGSGYLSGSTAYATWTGTGNPNWVGEVGFGGVGFRTTQTASMTWTGLRGNKIRFFYRNAGITGSFRWQVDGGGFTTVTTPVGFALDPASVDVTGLSEVGTHTFRVEWVSGTVVACGVYAEKSTGVNVRRYGVSGRAASDYALNSLGRFRASTTNGSPTITCAAPGWFTSALLRTSPEFRFIAGPGIPAGAKITAVASAVSMTIDRNCTATATNVDVDICVRDTYGQFVPNMTTNFEPAFGLTPVGPGRPHALIIMLGANDPANADTTARQFRDGYSRILKPYYASSLANYGPSLIVCQEHQGNWFDIFNRWPEMTSVMESIASGMGGVFIDHWGIGRRQHQYGEDRGWFNDAIHPSALGHKEMYFDPIWGVLTLTGS